MEKITKKNIPVFKPLIESDEINAAINSLKVGWLGMGSDVKRFEDAVRVVCEFDQDDDKHVVAVSTGHAALHLSLMMIGIGYGDEVITPSFNNAADFQAIRACGANPVFVDVHENTLCINENNIEELITSKTKCIIAMDYDIFTCAHDKLALISKKTGIPILHDAAHSFGSKYKGIPIGNQHQYTIFSFDPVKTITCIDGGAVILNGVDAKKKLQSKRLIGMSQSAIQMYQNSRAWTYDVEELGFRYHMANLHAAIGVCQIQKINEIRKTRQDVCKIYHSTLSQLNWLHAPQADFKNINPFLYYIRVIKKDRDTFRKYMLDNGIDTGIHWQAGHSFTFFKDCRKGCLKVTNKIVKEIVSLPLHSKMNESDYEHIIRCVKSFDG